ncbi:energy-coupling factor ABC transporter ATP-binding protein [Alkalicella caledoniensis]|uniref:Energy-coupling factor ABC transporter ATP-binding protein n=1 Tax=Alkalicella caledoniensis TaxID=2731377 RepID=A0A7G9W4N3_ALKCA|nr:energy-coupling factor ABC transporter ATP-binding protein [Alkalicella caledoniensis]QNO13645.1 energy-coupling factor ABC transporter ATP-binding protein [Alkalicella caledoniensis]
MEHIVKAKDVTFIYPDKTKVQLMGEFVAEKGKRTVVLGCNGSGKTTLFKGIIGLMKSIEGELSVFDINPYKKFHTFREKVGVVFQNSDEQIIAPTVFDDIALTLRNNKLPEKEIKERVQWILSELNLEGLANKVPHYLSGGEKKKVAIAGALVTNPEILLLDEPFNGLDPKSTKSIIDLINHFNSHHGTSLIITTHAMELVSSISDITYVFNKGEVAGKARGAEIFKNQKLLTDASLIQPQLYQMFKELINMGFPIEYPESPLDGANKILEAHNNILNYKKVN